MAQFTVDSNQVAQAAAATRTVAERIRTDVGAMMGQLTILQNSWGGSASIAFTECAHQWRSTQTQVETALDHISTQLGVASSTYDSAETQATGLFTG